ncbi:hypothetical protein PHYPSEUDO_014782 [Phytophthora pseudosyringae]|uniref:Uncharacterized protein n=1 Tax=Phytophthora pseudosyringae TaxID=221518 RepID=A0A8T1V6I9_9STRA|nr:hypothetical protein PHYPSEUDO_014782 [Phytophthora pseudosyringae]
MTPSESHNSAELGASSAELINSAMTAAESDNSVKIAAESDNLSESGVSSAELVNSWCYDTDDTPDSNEAVSDDAKDKLRAKDALATIDAAPAEAPAKRPASKRKQKLPPSSKGMDACIHRMRHVLGVMTQ